MFQQIVANGLVAGSTYALVALGFGLIFQVCRFFHFAHGGVYACAAYVAYAGVNSLGISIWVAVPIAVLGAAILGSGIEILIYSPLRRRSASSLIFLIASLGVLIVLQNCLSLAFGDATVRLRSGEVSEGINVLGARITVVQIMTVAISVALSLGTWAWLRYSRWGCMLRAVATDFGLSSVVGIQSDRVIMLTFAIGSALAAVAAILVAYDTDLTPTMGFRALLMGVVAVIVGGIGSIPGYFLGGIFVGLAQHLGVWKLPTEWQDAIVFLVLILFLLLRPQGFLGTPLRRSTV